MRWISYILVIVFAFGCAIKDEVRDGLWEIRSDVRTASLVQRDANTLTLDFNYEYLLGLVDNEGIEEVLWTYALVDSSKAEIVSETQQMREPQPNRTEVFVQGERPRELDIELGVLDPLETYVLWVTVTYRDTILTEVLVPVRIGESYISDTPLGDIEVFSTR